MGYRQLTQTQRYQTHARHDLGMSQRQIGRELGIYSSTISRELRQNATSGGYNPEQAQSLSDHRRGTAWKWAKRLPSMITAVADQLREEWSPEQIGGFMAPLAGVGVSHQWIYSLIWDDKARGGDLWRHLRQPKRRSKHRAQAKSAGLGKIPNRVGIEHRPAEVDGRLTIGHWEGDTVIQGYKQSGLVTLVESCSGYLLAARLPKVTAQLTQAFMIQLLKRRRGAVQTITLDNGSEFAGHVAVSKAVTAATYFYDPYCSGQRGSNENTNGLIRQYFPKGTDFRQVTDAELRKVVRKLNDHPRKRCRHIVADKGYDSDDLRRYCDRHRMKPIIAQRKMHRKPRPGLPRGFDKPKYRERNVIERGFGWLKELRRIATRYDKRARSFRAMVCLACIDRCLRVDFSYKT